MVPISDENGDWVDVVRAVPVADLRAKVEALRPEKPGEPYLYRPGWTLALEAVLDLIEEDDHEQG